MHPPRIRPQLVPKNHRGVDLISDVLPLGRLWYEQAPDAVEYAKFRSRSRHALIRVYDEEGKVIEKRAEIKLSPFFGFQHSLKDLTSEYFTISFLIRS